MTFYSANRSDNISIFFVYMVLNNIICFYCQFSLCLLLLANDSDDPVWRCTILLYYSWFIKIQSISSIIKIIKNKYTAMRSYFNYVKKDAKQSKNSNTILICRRILRLILNSTYLLLYFFNRRQLVKSNYLYIILIRKVSKEIISLRVPVYHFHMK